MPPLSPHTHEEPKEEWGAMIGTTIIVVLITLGGLYFFITENIKVHQQTNTEEGLTS